MKLFLALITSLALIGSAYAADDKEGPGKGEIK